MEKNTIRRSRRGKNRRRTSIKKQSRRRTFRRRHSRKRTSRRRVSRKRISRRRNYKKNMRGGQGTFDSIEEEIASLPQGTFDSLEEEIASLPSYTHQLVSNREPQTQEEEALQLEMAIQNSLMNAHQTPAQDQGLYFVLIPGSSNEFGNVPYQEKISQMIKDNLGERYILKHRNGKQCGDKDNDPAKCVEDKKTGRYVRRPCSDISYECLKDIFLYNRDKKKCLISTSQGSAILVELLVNLLVIEDVNCFENIECVVFFSPALIYVGETYQGNDKETIIRFLTMCRDYNIPILLFHNEFGSFKFNPRLGDAYPYNNSWTNHIISYCDSHAESKSIPIRCTNHSFFIIDGKDTREEHNPDNYIYQKLEENGMDALIQSLNRGEACGEKKDDNEILFSGILEKMFEWCVDRTNKASIVGEIEGINAEIERMVEEIEWRNARFGY